MDSSSSFSISCSLLGPDLDLAKWVDSMRKSIEDEDQDTNNTDVSICTVPKVLLNTDPDSYIPQQVALGPFHQWRLHVYDMQKYKLAAARKARKQKKVAFETIVEAMKREDEAQIRASYHKFLDMDADALVWMMTVDMAFLLEFLQVYYMREQGQKLEIASRLASVVDVYGKKPSHITILRDVVKLENQIPLFLVKKMLDHLHTEKSSNETLQIMLMGLYRELSPFRYPHQSPKVDVDHLLDFLCHMTIPKHKELGIDDEPSETRKGFQSQTPRLMLVLLVSGERERCFTNAGHVKRFLDYIWNIIKKVYLGFVNLVKKIRIFRAIHAGVKLPWKIISSLHILKFFKESVENMLAHFQEESKERWDDETNDSSPLLEEILIPSVTEMAKAGISFVPVNGTISEIRFNAKTSTLYLPMIRLDVNTEVYLRNLVAYEACVASGPLILARYTELMNGIIDTEEDAKYLKDRMIVLNHLKSDKDVADMWNEMSKCVKMTKVPSLDKVIEEVNKRYHKTWRVSRCVFGSWKILTLLATIFMLFLSTVQTFCSVYSCPRVFKQIPDLGNTPE